jgi:hypothetical protein
MSAASPDNHERRKGERVHRKYLTFPSDASEKEDSVKKLAVGNGFGQMGQSKYQFILRSVSDVEVEEAKRGPDTIPSKLPDHSPERHNP